ncbi:MAG: MFS transporter [Pseudomonadota bacterium]
MPKFHNRAAILAMLTLVYVFNFIDRQIIGVLTPFIQADLGVSDAQMGLLSGAMFALFYTVIGIPVASLADLTKTIRVGSFSLRLDRVTIIAISLATWSVFTLLTGFAGGFVALALLRVGVAIGEAGCSPPSHSLISDLYTPRERGRALSIYSLGIPFGVMIAYFAGAFFVSGGTVDWRTAYIAVGLPGVVIAIVVKVFMPEPERGKSDGAATPPLPFKQALGKLAVIRSYWTMALGIAFASFGSYAVNAFLTKHAVNTYPDFPLTQLLVFLGIGNAIFYAAGTYLGGAVADRFGQKNVAAYASVPALTTALAAVCLIFAVSTNHLVVFLALICSYIFFLGFYLGPSFSVAQNLAGVSVRATSTAVFFFVLNLIALGGGPTVVGGLSTWFAGMTGDPVAGLRYALMSLALPYVISVVMFSLTARTLPADWARAQSDPDIA